MNERPSLICVDPALIGEVWPHVEPLLSEAYTRFGSQDERRTIEADVLEGRSLLWVAWSDNRKIEAALVTDLVKEDGELICRLRALAGRSLRRWIKLLGLIEEYANKEGCATVRYFGRQGWRAMLGSDYRVTHVQAEKRLA